MKSIGSADGLPESAYYSAVYYPKACLFCGIPNGQMSTTTIVMRTSCTSTAPTMHRILDKKPHALQTLKRLLFPARTPL